MNSGKVKAKADKKKKNIDYTEDEQLMMSISSELTGISLETFQDNSPVEFFFDKKISFQEDKFEHINREVKQEDNFTEAITTALKPWLDKNEGQGLPLPEPIMLEMENILGVDLKDVRIFLDDKAHLLSKSIGALAFTYGQDIYFQKGEFNPTTFSGKQLLVHELMHTIEQKDGEKIIQKKDDPKKKNQQKATTGVAADNTSVYRDDTYRARTEEYFAGVAKGKEKYLTLFRQYKSQDKKVSYSVSDGIENDFMALINEFDTVSNPYSTISKLDSKKAPGWIALLIVAFDKSEKIKQIIIGTFRQWIEDGKPGVYEFILGIAQENSLLGEYAKYVLLQKLGGLIDVSQYRKNIITELKASILVYKSLAPEQTGGTTANQSTTFVKDQTVFNANINATIKKCNNANPKELNDIAIRLKTLESQMTLAASLLDNLNIYYTLSREDDGMLEFYSRTYTEGVYHSIAHLSYIFIPDELIALTTLDTGKDMALYAMKYLDSVIKEYEKNIYSTIFSDLETKLSNAVEGVAQLRLLIGTEMEGAETIHNTLDEMEFEMLAIKELIPEFRKQAPESPNAFNQVWLEILKKIQVYGVQMEVIREATKIYSCWEGYDSSYTLGTLNTFLFLEEVGIWVNSRLLPTYNRNPPEGFIKRNTESIKQQQAIFSKYFSKAVELCNLAKGKPSQEIFKEIETLKKNEELVKAYSAFETFHTKDEYLGKAYQIATAVAITIAAIYTAGAAANAAMVALGAETLATGTGALAIGGSELIAEITGLVVSGTIFTLTEKTLNEFIYGNGQWDTLGTDVVKSIITFGFLGKVMKGYQGATNKFSSYKIPRLLAGFVVENIAFVSLEATFNIYDNAVKDAEEEAAEFSFSESTKESVEFLLALKIAMSLLKGRFPVDVEEMNPALEEKLNNQSIVLKERLKILEKRDLLPEETKQFKLEVLELLETRQQILREAINDPAHKAISARLKNISTAITRLSTRLRKSTVAEFKILRSEGLPDVVYFEGNVEAIKKMLRLKGGIVSQPYIDKNVFLYTRGKSKLIFIHRNSEVNGKVDIQRISRDMNINWEETASDFWKQVGDKSFALQSTDISIKLVTEALAGGWRAGEPLADNVLERAKREIATQKHRKLYNTFGEKYEEIPVLKSVGELPFETMERLLEFSKIKVSETEFRYEPTRLDRIQQLYPDLADIRNVEFEPEFIKVMDSRGNTHIRIDKAPLIGDKLSKRYYENNIVTAEQLNKRLEKLSLEERQLELKAEEDIYDSILAEGKLGDFIQEMRMVNESALHFKERLDIYLKHVEILKDLQKARPIAEGMGSSEQLKNQYITYLNSLENISIIEGVPLVELERISLPTEMRDELTIRIMEPIFGKEQFNIIKSLPKEYADYITNNQKLILDYLRRPDIRFNKRKREINKIFSNIQKSLKKSGADLSKFDFTKVESAVNELSEESFDRQLGVKGDKVIYNGEVIGTKEELLQKINEVNNFYLLHNISKHFALFEYEALDSKGMNEISIRSRNIEKENLKEYEKGLLNVPLLKSEGQQYIIDIGVGGNSYAMDLLSPAEKENTILIQTEYEPTFVGPMLSNRELSWIHAAPRTEINSVTIIGNMLSNMNTYVGDRSVRVIFINNINADYKPAQYNKLAEQLMEVIAENGQVQIQWDISEEKSGKSRGHITGDELEKALNKLKNKYGRDFDIEKFGEPELGKGEGVKYDYTITPSKYRDKQKGIEKAKKSGITPPSPENMQRWVFTFKS